MAVNEDILIQRRQEERVYRNWEICRAASDRAGYFSGNLHRVWICLVALGREMIVLGAKLFSYRYRKYSDAGFTAD